MINIKINMRFALCLFCLLMIKLSYADNRIEVVTVECSAVSGDALGKTSKSVQSKSVLLSGNVLSTSANARAVVRVGTDGFVVMGKNSKVEINQSNKDKPGFFKQISGVVYYAINSIKGKQKPVEVRTATTTIGIRGTRFLVTDTEDLKEIGMRKGVVNVTSVDGDFEIVKKSTQDEFEAFKREGEVAIAKNTREFEEYKAKTQQEFIEYKKEFSLAANRMVSFDGKRVVELPLSDETKANMEDFEKFAEESLNKITD